MKKMPSVPCILVVCALTYAAWPQDLARADSLGERAPFLDINVLSGRPVDLQKDRGKYVTIVEFWATWCAPCRYSASQLSSLQKKYADKGLVVVGISDEDEATVESFIKLMAAKMDYTVAVDRDQKTTASYMAAFNVDSIPHAFLVDKSGRIVWHGNPVLPALEDALVALLNRDRKSSPNERSGPTRNWGKTKTSSSLPRYSSTSDSE